MPWLTTAFPAATSGFGMWRCISLDLAKFDLSLGMQPKTTILIDALIVDDHQVVIHIDFKKLPLHDNF